MYMDIQQIRPYSHIYNLRLSQAILKKKNLFELRFAQKGNNKKNLLQELFCNSDTVGRDCSSEYCECVHVEKVGLGDVVEFVMVDEGKTFDANHPMHLHGYSYRVVAMGKVRVQM